MFICLRTLEGWGSNFKFFGAYTATGRHMLCPSSQGYNVIFMSSAAQLGCTMADTNCKQMIHPPARASWPMAGPLSWHMEDLHSNLISRSQDPICLHCYVLLWKSCPSAVPPLFLWERRCFGVNYTRRLLSMQTEWRNALCSQEPLLDISCLLA